MHRPVVENKRNIEKTRRRILDAAAKEFAEKGLAGSRVDAIAKRANVNKAMIYYIYQSKENLHLSVIENLFEEKIATVDSQISEQSFSVDAFLLMFDLYFDAFFERQDYVRIMINDAVTGGVTLRRLREKRPDLFAIFDTLSTILDASVRKGTIRPIDADKGVSLIVFILSSLVCMLPLMDIIRPRNSAGYRELRDIEKWRVFLRDAFMHTLSPGT